MVEKSNTGGFWPSLQDPFRSLGTRLADWLAPASDAKANEKAYAITMELPGVAEEDIHLTVEHGLVTVKGEKKTEREEKGDTWFFSERQYGSFQRSFRLPQDADEGAVEAALKDGVLTVTVPKQTPAESKAKRVAVKKG
jgi:HSP20 family protein